MKVIHNKKEKKVNNDHIIAGTEEAYKKDEKVFTEKYKEYKANYIKKNTIASMVYENGAATALLYKEITRLNNLLMTNLKKDGK
jgi:hypothetical protein